MKKILITSCILVITTNILIGQNQGEVTQTKDSDSIYLDEFEARLLAALWKGPNKFRPKKSYLSITFASEPRNIEKILTKENYSIPAIQVSYFITNNLAIRTGFSLKVDNKKYYGDADPSTNSYNYNYNDHITTTTKFTTIFGVNYHIPSDNLLDLYAGSDLMFGLKHMYNKNNYKYENGDFYDTKNYYFNYIFGFIPYVGMRFFPTKYPLSVGCEVGFSGIWGNDNKITTEINSRINGLSKYSKYHTTDGEDVMLKHQGLKSRKFEIKETFRITISYYFTAW